MILPRIRTVTGSKTATNKVPLNHIVIGLSFEIVTDKNTDPKFIRKPILICPPLRVVIMLEAPLPSLEKHFPNFPDATNFSPSLDFFSLLFSIQLRFSLVGGEARLLFTHFIQINNVEDHDGAGGLQCFCAHHKTDCMNVFFAYFICFVELSNTHKFIKLLHFRFFSVTNLLISIF